MIFFVPSQIFFKSLPFKRSCCLKTRFSRDLFTVFNTFKIVAFLIEISFDSFFFVGHADRLSQKHKIKFKTVP